MARRVQDVEKSFNQKGLKLAPGEAEGLICCLRTMGCDARFPLHKTQDEGASLDLIDKMETFYRVRVDRHAFDKFLEDVSRKEVGALLGPFPPGDC